MFRHNCAQIEFLWLINVYNPWTGFWSQLPIRVFILNMQKRMFTAGRRCQTIGTRCTTLQQVRVASLAFNGYNWWNYRVQKWNGLLNNFTSPSGLVQLALPIIPICVSCCLSIFSIVRSFKITRSNKSVSTSIKLRNSKFSTKSGATRKLNCVIWYSPMLWFNS